MTQLLDCEHPGPCDFKTRAGKCWAHLTSTDFGNNPCSFKKIDGRMAHKVVIEMIQNEATLAEIYLATGWTEAQVWRFVHGQKSNRAK